MLFKYFIEFNNDGEIKSFHESRKGCKNCKEYLVKLIPVDRKQEDLEQKVDKFSEVADNLLLDIKKFDTELNRMLKGLRRKRV